MKTITQDYTLAFSRKCMELGVLAGSVGAKCHYSGLRGHSRHLPWSVWKPGVLSGTFRTVEEATAYLEGYKAKLAAAQ